MTLFGNRLAGDKPTHALTAATPLSVTRTSQASSGLLIQACLMLSEQEQCSYSFHPSLPESLNGT